MIFLIEYSRLKGRIITFKHFNDQDLEKAANVRLEMELELNRRGTSDREIVLLEATSEEDLRKTHRRYFENAAQIGSTG
jgi:hypothetical protein